MSRPDSSPSQFRGGPASPLENGMARGAKAQAPWDQTYHTEHKQRRQLAGSIFHE